MRKPLPDPGRGGRTPAGASPGRPDPGRSGRCDPGGGVFAEASMLTTAALMRSVTSAKLAMVDRGAAEAGRTWSSGAVRGTDVSMPDRPFDRPASDNPTRKASDEHNTSVTIGRRLDISVGGRGRSSEVVSRSRQSTVVSHLPENDPLDRLYVRGIPLR